MYSVSLPLPHRILIIFFAISGALLAFLFGGNFPLAMGAMPIFCAVLLACSAFLPRPTLQWKGFNWLVAGVFAPVMLVLLWSLMQIIPLSPASEWVSPFWSLRTGDASLAPATISFNPNGTLAWFGYAAGLFALGWSTFRIGQSHPRPLLVAVAATISLCSLYGIFIFSLGNQSVLWLPKIDYTDSLSATFINRNSFATFAGLGMLTSLSLMLYRVGEISQRLSQRQRIKAFILLVLRPGLPWAFLALTCFIALVLTNSRAGLTASLCGVIVLIGSLAGMRPAARLPLTAMLGSLLIVSFIILAVAGDTLGSRLDRIGNDAGVRSQIYATGNEIIHSYPLVGTGLGTFADAFSTANVPTHIAFKPTRTINAHNTYIELTAELGYPAVILLGGAVFSLLLAFLNGLRIRRRAIIWPALGVSSMVLVGGHALVDFSLSIPAVAFTTISMLMLALAQSLPLKAESDAKENKKRWQVAPYYYVAPLALVLLCYSSWQTFSNVYASLASPTLTNIDYGYPVNRIQLARTQSQLEKCLSVNPMHPTCGFSLAQVYLSFATGYGLTGNNKQIATVYLAIAQQQYQNALSRQPVNSTAWYRLSRINAYMQEKPEAITALNNSLLTGPAEPAVAYLRVPYMLSLLPEVSADDYTLYANNIISLWRAGNRHLLRNMRTSPEIYPMLAEVIQNEPHAREEWQRYFKKPFPPAALLGEAPENK